MVRSKTGMGQTKTLERPVLNSSGPGIHFRTVRSKLFGPRKTIERIVLNSAGCMCYEILLFYAKSAGFRSITFFFLTDSQRRRRLLVGEGVRE